MQSCRNTWVYFHMISMTYLTSTWHSFVDYFPLLCFQGHHFLNSFLFYRLTHPFLVFGFSSSAYHNIFFPQGSVLGTLLLWWPSCVTSSTLMLLTTALHTLPTCYISNLGRPQVPTLLSNRPWLTRPEFLRDISNSRYINMYWFFNLFFLPCFFPECNH
jgi:hypothetical protein